MIRNKVVGVGKGKHERFCSREVLEELYKNLDQVTAYFSYQTGGLPSRTTVLELLTWVRGEIELSEEEVSTYEYKC